MYQEYPYFIREGWICPKCKTILNPSTNFCPFCNDKRVVYATKATPEWIYKEDTRTDSIYDNEWWKTATNMPAWEDMVRRTGLLEDD